MHLKNAEMLAIVVQEYMKLGDNIPEQWEALTCKHLKLVNSPCGPAVNHDPEWRLKMPHFLNNRKVSS